MSRNSWRHRLLTEKTLESSPQHRLMHEASVFCLPLCDKPKPWTDNDLIYEGGCQRLLTVQNSESVSPTQMGQNWSFVDASNCCHFHMQLVNSQQETNMHIVLLQTNPGRPRLQAFAETGYQALLNPERTLQHMKLSGDWKDMLQ